jgi:hypothetical protein
LSNSDLLLLVKYSNNSLLRVLSFDKAYFSTSGSSEYCQKSIEVMGESTKKKLNKVDKKIVFIKN